MPRVYLMDTIELFGFIATGKTREEVLVALWIKPKSPKEILDETKRNRAGISKALYELEKKKLVRRLTPNKKSKNIYVITDLGKEVLEYRKKVQRVAEVD